MAMRGEQGICPTLVDRLQVAGALRFPAAVYAVFVTANYAVTRLQCASMKIATSSVTSSTDPIRSTSSSSAVPIPPDVLFHRYFQRLKAR